VKHLVDVLITYWSIDYVTVQLSVLHRS